MWDGPGGKGGPGFGVFSKLVRLWQRVGLKLRQWGSNFVLNRPGLEERQEGKAEKEKDPGSLCG